MALANIVPCKHNSIELYIHSRLIGFDYSKTISRFDIASQCPTKATEKATSKRYSS